MRELTLGLGISGQVRKTFLSSKVASENGRLRTWVTEIINFTVVLFCSVFSEPSGKNVFIFMFYYVWVASLSTKILHPSNTA